MSSKLLSFVLLFAGFAFSLPAATPIFPCVKQFGAEGRQLLHSISTDSRGNFAIAGSLYGAADFGGGPLTSRGDRDMFVAKYDSGCRHLWSKQFGSPREELALQIRFDSHDDLIVAGNVRGAVDLGGGSLQSAGDYDVVLAKLAADGSHVWSKRFGDASYQRVDGIDLDPADNIAITGTFRGALDFGLGALSGQVYVARLSASGSPIFNRAFSSTEEDFQFRAVATDRQGNVAVAGIFRGTVSLGGESFSFSGKTRFGYGTIVGKFTANGDYIWSAAYPTEGETLAFGPTGVLFMWTYLPPDQRWSVRGATLQGPLSAIINPDDSGPPPVWKTFPDGFRPAGANPTILVEEDGIVSIAATLTSTADLGGGTLASAGSYDIVVARFDQYGRHLYSSVHGDKRPQFLAGLASSRSGDLIVAGSFCGAVTFGDQTLYDSDGSGTAPGSEQTEEDIFVATIDRRSKSGAGASVPAASPFALVALGVTLLVTALRSLRGWA